MMNFKKIEVSGNTKEEAFANVPFNMTLPGSDCTQALRKYKEKNFSGRAFTDSDLKQFMVEQLEKKTKGTPGTGLYIVVNPAVANTRERPYKITSIKNESGARKTGKVFQLIEEKTNRVIAETTCKMIPQVDAEGNKILDEQGNPRMKVSAQTVTEAKDLAKKLITEEGFRGKGYARVTKQVIEGQDRVFEFEYVPSKGSHPGTYICFGVEA